MLGDRRRPGNRGVRRPSPTVVGSAPFPENEPMRPPSARPARLAALLGMLAAAAAARAADAPHPPPAPERLPERLEAWRAPEPVPVRFDGNVLFFVRSGVADLTPALRAERIEERLRRVAGEASPGKARVEEGLFSDIYIGDQFIASISDEEAGATGAQRAAWARILAQQIGDAVEHFRRERAPGALVRSAIGAAIATALLVLFLLALRLVRRKAGAQLERTIDALLSRARIQHQELITPEAHVRLIRWVGRTIRLGLVLLALVVWLQVVLHLFPWTRDPADRWLRFTLGAGGSVAMQVVRFLPNLVYIVLFCLVGYGANRANAIFFEAVKRGAIRLPGFYPDWSRVTSRLVSVFIYGLVAVAIFPYLPGAGSSAFQAIGIFFGAMISLGSGSSVANAVSGVVITYMRPFVVGDFVRIADATGTVKEQNMLAVRVLTIRNETVTIPASMVLANQIVNFSEQARGTGLALATSVTIGYDTPWRQVHGLLLDAAARTSAVQANPKPWVIQTALNDFYVRYELDVYIDDPASQHFILSELNQNVQDAFFKAGVEILSPHYAQLRDGNKVAIPDEWLPPGSRDAAFKVQATVIPPAAPGGAGGKDPKT